MANKKTRRRFEEHPTIPFSEWDVPAASDDPQAIDTFAVRQSADTNVHATLREGAPLSELDDPRPASGEADPTHRLLYYISLGSGSSGNCYYVGSQRGGILVDAGVKPDFVESSLAANGISMKMVKALLLTHDHSDHVRYAYSILRTYKHIRLFCTNRVINGILRRTSIPKRIREYHNAIFKEIPFKIADFEITAFEVPHDSVDSMGFSIAFDGRNFVIATDLGEIQSRAAHYIGHAHYLVIEANYDLDMLRFGRYPAYLKARIQTEKGHLDNMYTANYLRENFPAGLSHIFLCHLSKENNTPDKAFKAVCEGLTARRLKVGRGEETLSDRAADVQLTVLPRFEATRLYVFRP